MMDLNTTKTSNWEFVPTESSEKESTFKEMLNAVKWMEQSICS